MSQFQVYRLGGGRLLFDLQSDHVETATRVMAPLVPEADGRDAFERLEPVLEIDGTSYVLELSELVAVPLQQIPLTFAYDMSSEQDRVKTALNLLFWGF